MRLIFFGSGAFAVPSLLALQQRYPSAIIQIVTQPDRPVGRQQLLQSTPIKQAAEQLGLPILYDFNHLPPADLAIVVYYGVILPVSVLQQFPRGVMNLHPSLLPRWRGPSPIRSALLADDQVTGVSVMMLDAGMDTGSILRQVPQVISEQDTNMSLEASLAKLGAEVLTATLADYWDGKIVPAPQSSNGITISKLVHKTDGELTVAMSARALWNRYRALQPWPGVYFVQHGKRYRITAAHWSVERFVCDQIQPAGKTAINLVDFKRGYPTISFPNIL